MSILYSRTEGGYFFKVSGAPAVLHISMNSIGTTGESEFPLSGLNHVAAIMGVIQLRSSRYVIVATRGESAGFVGPHQVFRVAEYNVLPLSHSFLKDDDEQKYLELLKFHLDSATLYYAHGYDLTNSYQRNSAGAPVDRRFFWNQFISSELVDLAAANPALQQFVTPMIYGYVKIVSSVVNNHPVSFGIITRRSTLRAGTRYFRRGIDSQGNVANFNETEQLLILNRPAQGDAQYEVLSYLQTRGSVPIYWAEINNLKYKPDLSISEESAIDAATLHFNQQIHLYGKNYLINLVNSHGYEKPIKDGYESLVQALNNPNLDYIYWDYHHECRKLQWHKVKLLIDILVSKGLSKDDYFHGIFSYDSVSNQLTSHQILSLQKSIVRTNCMDCLDRTNVVQSTLAHWILQSQFEKLGLLPHGTHWEQDKHLLSQFQNMWADNADAVSKAYSGTGALKTDYTRTGKRTKVGALNDLINSITRYYKNNLKDGPRQDAYDLFLGNYTPNGSYSPFEDSRPQLTQLIPYLLFGSSFMLLTVSLFPKGSIFQTSNLLLIVSCLSVILWSGYNIAKNGLQFVNWPKLIKLEYLNKDRGVFTKSSKYTSARGSKKD